MTFQENTNYSPGSDTARQAESFGLFLYWKSVKGIVKFLYYACFTTVDVFKFLIIFLIS